MLKGTSLKATAAIVLLLCLACTVSHAGGEDGTHSGKEGIISLAEKTMELTGDERRDEAAGIFREGMKSGNLLVTTYGSALLGFHYLLEHIPDSALFYLSNAIIISESDRSGHSGHRKEYDYIISQTYNNISLYYLNYSLDYYKASEYLFKALEHCSRDDQNTFYPLVLSNLTLVHYYRKDTSGMEYARALSDWSARNDGLFAFHADYCLALMHYIKEEYGPAKDYALKAIGRIGGPDNDRFKRELIFAYNILGKIYIETGDMGPALDALEKAARFAREGTQSDITDTYLSLGNLYIEQKDYAKALETMLTGISLCKEDTVEVHYNELLERISYIYTLENDYRNAFRYYMLFHDNEKELYDRNKEYALGEIRAKYNLEQYENRLKEQEIVVLKRNRQLILLSFAVIIILSAGGAVWYFYYKKNKYYEAIVKQYRERVSLDRQIREMGGGKNPDKYNKSSLSENKGNDLWEKVRTSMEGDKAYHDSDLTIDKLAEKLETNRSYLSRVINEHSGMNFNQYINKYRIEEAIRLITESGGNCLLKTLAFDLGFKSTSGFNKSFSKETGVPPSVFSDKCRN